MCSLLQFLCQNEIYETLQLKMKKILKTYETDILRK
jgi:hypothetical protein